MAKVTFHHHGGAEADVVDVAAGTSLMRAAVSSGVAGIIGECGGQAMCATCHVYVRQEHLDRLPRMSEDEDEMLDCAAAPRDPDRSRLACQIAVGPELESIDVDIPSIQV